jgi:hypothetical protein
VSRTDDTGTGEELPSTNDGSAAAVNVMAWSGDTIPMRVELRPPATAGEPYVMAVHLANHNDYKIDPYVDVGASLDQWGSLRGDDDTTSPRVVQRGERGSRDERTMPPHTSRTIEFEVTPVGPARDVSFLVHAYQPAHDLGDDPHDGAMMIRTFHLPAGADEPDPTVAAK